MKKKIALLASALLLVAPRLPAQRRVTSPLQQFGHNIGDDYFLVNYAQMIDYWQKLARESNRVRLVRIGNTAEGRPMWMAIITAPENFRKLGRFQDISRRLAHGDEMTDAQARALAAEGKAVVWVDGGLHATEVLGAQQLIQTVYEMASGTDGETMRFLRDDILLAVPANPDGQDLVSDWYMREADTLRRTTERLPVLYHKYAGHDNNRDAYMASQPETQAMDSILFRAWYPQIMYNHHQPGPTGTVIFAPPFRDPFNYNFDPLVPMELDLVGAAMHSRFVAEGKAGATMRSGQDYSTWWNGGMRTTVYFHNMIGLLTEAIGNPTPMEIPVVPSRQLPHGDLPMPIAPQPWHFAQSIAYELTANRAVLDVASRYRETLLYNAWKMARNSIARGSTDSWTITPKKVNALKLALTDTTREGSAGGVRSAAMAKWRAIMRDPAARDPRGYIIPSSQPDFPTATKFVNALIKNGISVLRATAPFSVGGRNYPADSYVVMTAQAFRPHVLDMFEPQDHPDDFPYPGAPPTPPYDNAGWTLAYQMGVEFDRVLDAFSGPFVPVTGVAAAGHPLPGSAQSDESGSAYLLSRSQNDVYTVVNRLLARGAEVYTLDETVKAPGYTREAGTFFIPVTGASRQIVADASREKGISAVVSAANFPRSSLRKVRRPRIALYDQYGGLITSGWARFIFDQFEFPYTVVYPKDIDGGNLSDKYDVIVFPDGATFVGAVPARQRRAPAVQDPERVPPEFRNRIGELTAARSIPAIRAFLAAGGTVLAVGTATEAAYALDLPIASALVDSVGVRLPETKFYVPGSILRMRIDTATAVGRGMHGSADVYYDNAPAFRLLPAAAAAGVRRVAWVDSPTPLRSGWAWGQRYLNGAAEIVTAKVGKGTLILYGPDPYFRSQPHGTFKLFFNGIFYQDTP